LSPQPTPAELETYYPKNYWFTPEMSAASRLEEIYRHLVLLDHVRFVERAVRESGEGGPILDVGCGGGLFLRMLRKRGFAAMGLDFSHEAAHVAWSVNHAPAACGNLASAPFPPESCSAVPMFHVLEHLYEPRSYLEASRQLLR